MQRKRLRAKLKGEDTCHQKGTNSPEVAKRSKLSGERDLI